MIVIKILYLSVLDSTKSLNHKKFKVILNIQLCLSCNSIPETSTENGIKSSLQHDKQNPIQSPNSTNKCIVTIININNHIQFILVIRKNYNILFF